LEAVADFAELVGRDRRGGVQVDLDAAELLLDHLIERGGDRDKVPEALLAVEDEQEVEGEIADASLKDLAEARFTLAGGEDARGEKLAELRVGAGEFEQVFEFAGDALEHLAPSLAFGKLEE